MVLRSAKFESKQDRSGVVAYDSVTMYVYPIVFKDEEELQRFSEWVQTEYVVPLNGYSADHYSLYETWVDEGRP